MVDVGVGDLVKVGIPEIRGIPIRTVSPDGRIYQREKRDERASTSKKRFLFGTVVSGPFTPPDREPHPVWFIRWAGRRYRTSFLPARDLLSAK